MVHLGLTCRVGRVARRLHLVVASQVGGEVFQASQLFGAKWAFEVPLHILVVFRLGRQKVRCWLALARVGWLTHLLICQLILSYDPWEGENCGGRGRHVVLAGGRCGRVGGVQAGSGLQTPGQELLVQLAHQERGARHHLHLPRLWIV